MIRDFNFDSLSEPGELDSLGTIRVSQEFGNVAVYIKINDNQWQAVYVDPIRGENLVSRTVLSDAVACLHRVVFVPKPFV